jgi:hypothetical protein
VLIPDVMTPELDELLGTLDTPMSEIDHRVRAAYGDEVIVWEGDAATFQYSFVNASASALGYELGRWLVEPTFWADVVVHAEDREDAVSYCALATALKQHHVFDYRACARDGRVVWYRDYVKVLLGPRNVPARLRGLMIDVTSRYRDRPSFTKLHAPTRELLGRLG